VGVGAGWYRRELEYTNPWWPLLARIHAYESYPRGLTPARDLVFRLLNGNVPQTSGRSALIDPRAFIRSPVPLAKSKPSSPHLSGIGWRLRHRIFRLLTSSRLYWTADERFDEIAIREIDVLFSEEPNVITHDPRKVIEVAFMYSTRTQRFVRTFTRSCPFTNRSVGFSPHLPSSRRRFRSFPCGERDSTGRVSVRSQILK
jgi:hypothetical protein